MVLNHINLKNKKNLNLRIIYFLSFFLIKFKKSKKKLKKKIRKD